VTRLEDFVFVLASNNLDDQPIAQLEVGVSDELQRKLKRRAVGNSYSASTDGTSAIQTDVSYVAATCILPGAYDGPITVFKKPAHASLTKGHRYCS
jgi:hypothetical protein